MLAFTIVADWFYFLTIHINTEEMSVNNGSSNNNRSTTNTRGLFVILFVLTVGFSLTSAGVLRSNNNAIGITPAAYAAKSKGSSSGGSSSSSGGGGSSSATKKNEEEEEKQESPQEK